MVRRGGPRDRYPKTEYGGGEGDPGLGADNSRLPLRRIPGSVGKAARVLRTVGARGDYSGVDRLNADGTPYAPDQAAAADLDAKTNTYRKDAGTYGDRLV